MTNTQRESITKHGQNLLAIFPQATERDPVALCKKLRRLEAKAHSIGLQMCNGPEMSEEEINGREADVLVALDDLIHYINVDVPVFVNKDPRGYALKIDDDWMREHKPSLHQDWGGYGIIAPEINE